MKKKYFLIILILPLFACNLKEQMEKMEKINTELESKFDHNNIFSSYNWGTEKGDNYFQITFYNYDMSKKTYSELEELAKNVEQFFTKKNPKFDDLEFIEVRFTKQDKNSADSFVTFKTTE